MTSYSVVDVSTWPSRFVLAVASERGAQLFARRLGEIEGAPRLSYLSGGGAELPDADPALRDAARDPALHTEIADELRRERWANPEARAKWLAFRFRGGLVRAYPEHDPAVSNCAADPALIDVIAFYGEMPSGRELFDLWRTLPRVTEAPR